MLVSGLEGYGRCSYETDRWSLHLLFEFTEFSAKNHQWSEVRWGESSGLVPSHSHSPTAPASSHAVSIPTDLGLWLQGDIQR